MLTQRHKKGWILDTRHANVVKNAQSKGKEFFYYFDFIYSFCKIRTKRSVEGYKDKNLHTSPDRHILKGEVYK
jgi:hypothetical protein